jgi:hypothetical protein
LEDFRRALGRVQSDYGFYVECQANPAVALAGYDLSVDERSTLLDPEKLADVLKRGIGRSAARTTGSTAQSRRTRRSTPTATRRSRSRSRRSGGRGRPRSEPELRSG